MSALTDARLADEDWPGTYDLCHGPHGWHLESYTCENCPCWCWQDRDPIEGRCGFTAEKARDELVSILRCHGHQVDADGVAALTPDELVAESFPPDDVATPPGGPARAGGATDDGGGDGQA